IIIEPVIVRTAERRGVDFLFHGSEIETGRRKQHAALDAVTVHVLEPLARVGGQVAMLVDRRIVGRDLERRLVGFTVVAIAFEQKQQLAVGHSLNFRGAGAKGWLQIAFPYVIRFAHVAVDIDYPNSILYHCYLRSRSASSTTIVPITSDLPDCAARYL